MAAAWTVDPQSNHRSKFTRNGMSNQSGERFSLARTPRLGVLSCDRGESKISIMPLWIVKQGDKTCFPYLLLPDWLFMAGNRWIGTDRFIDFGSFIQSMLDPPDFENTTRERSHRRVSGSGPSEFSVFTPQVARRPLHSNHENYNSASAYWRQRSEQEHNHVWIKIGIHEDAVNDGEAHGGLS